jgi:hypothetical protein
MRKSTPLAFARFRVERCVFRWASGLYLNEFCSWMGVAPPFSL